MKAAEMLKELRLRSKMTQSELARALNVSQNAIHNWETGKRNMTIELIENLSKFFNVSPDIFLDEYDYSANVPDHAESILYDFENDLMPIGYCIYKGYEENEGFYYILYPDESVIKITEDDYCDFLNDSKKYSRYLLDRIRSDQLGLKYDSKKEN